MAGDQVIVGVNRYAQEEQTAIAFHLDPALEPGQVARLKEVRAGRDAARVAAHLAALRQAAARTDNLMPLIVSAVRDYVSVGEISDALRSVYGTYDS
jgi:methylmalonyl-CoA mutase N-terminal domain/subunit